jgi:HD-like signal output (HDOD) protein
VPALIATHLQLELLLQQPVVELRAVAEVLRRDPGATIEVLRLAGREWMPGEERAARLEDAIAGLSLASCQGAIERAVLGHDARSRTVALAWEHARQIALRMQEASAIEGLFHPDEAYLLGLLHELGGVPALLGWKHVPELGLGRSGRPAARTGMALARALAEQWRLPWFLISAFAELEEGRRSSPWMRLLSLAHGSAEGCLCASSRPQPRRSRVLSFHAAAASEVPAWKMRGGQHTGQAS